MNSITLLDLPDCMIEQVFEFLTYDEIAKKRMVCKKIDRICQQLLNRGFTKMMIRHSHNLRRIKSLLPRRESERRSHPLARHADVLTCIETRISMLSMTYTKYMDLNLCCFIPGKVIDEVLNILQLIETTSKPLRAHEVLQELRDISSMAIEHFDEKIAHLLKQAFSSLNTQPFSSTADDLISVHSHLSPEDFHFRLDVQQRCLDDKKYSCAISQMEGRYKHTIKKYEHMKHIQNKQARQLRNQSVEICEMRSQIVELKRRLEESDAKNREILAKICQITLDSSTSSTSTSEKTTRTARTATAILKRRINEPIQLTDDIIKKTKI